MQNAALARHLVTNIGRLTYTIKPMRAPRFLRFRYNLPLPFTILT